jgi:hypothetical protein
VLLLILVAVLLIVAVSLLLGHLRHRPWSDPSRHGLVPPTRRLMLIRAGALREGHAAPPTTRVEDHPALDVVVPTAAGGLAAPAPTRTSYRDRTTR